MNTSLNMKYKQPNTNSDPSRYYPSPELDDCDIDGDWSPNSLHPQGNNTSHSTADCPTLGNSPACIQELKFTGTQSFNLQQFSPSGHTFISQSYTPTSFDDHLADIDSEATTFLNSYRSPDSLRFNISDDQPYCPTDYECDDDHSDVTKTTKEDEYFTDDAAFFESKRKSISYQFTSFTQDDDIQTPKYDCASPSSNFIVDETSYLHFTSKRPSTSTESIDITMESESYATPDTTLVGSTRANDTFYIQTPRHIFSEYDIDAPFISESSQCSSPGYLPLDINTLNPNFDPDEDRWFVNPIEYDYCISRDDY
ncbi:hypothetical protein BGZ76_003050 [Entomortierella beljakovae]|nr:hypothetical protein BGZ76_003050 [Entomortierella beljakovae]